MLVALPLIVVSSLARSLRCTLLACCLHTCMQPLRHATCVFQLSYIITQPASLTNAFRRHAVRVVYCICTACSIFASKSGHQKFNKQFKKMTWRSILFRCENCCVAACKFQIVSDQAFSGCSGSIIALRCKFCLIREHAVLRCALTFFLLVSSCEPAFASNRGDPLPLWRI